MQTTACWKFFLSCAPLLRLAAAGSSVTGSVMLTASHMPMHNNGLKFFTAEGGLGKPDISAILETAAAKCEAAAVPLGDAILDGAFVLRQVREKSEACS